MPQIHFIDYFPRLLIALSLAMLAGPSRAGCGGGWEGDSTAGHIYIGEGDCDYRQKMILVKPRKGHERRFEFLRECAYLPGAQGSESGFVCRRGRRSPLAGASYRYRTDATQTDGCGTAPREYYACIKGCSARVPQEFSILPVDCDG